MLTPQYSAFTGRKKITSPYVDSKYQGFGFPVLEDTNLPVIIQDAINIHNDNRGQMKILKNYYDGVMGILEREKDVRPDIDHKVVIGLPKSSTDLLVGYFFSKPLTYIPRDTSDYQTTSDLNRIMDDLGVEKVNQDVLSDMCKYGVGYKMVLPDVKKIFGKHNVFISRLDPMNVFTIHSQILGEPTLCAVHVSTFSEVGSGSRLDGNTFNLVTVYLNKRTLVFKQPMGASLDWKHLESDTHHLLPIPVIEYELNGSRQGLYEQALSIVDAINVLLSDGVNDVAQLVQSILVSINAEIDEDQLKTLRDAKFVSLMNPQQGNPADLKYVSNQLNPTSMKYLVDKLEACYAMVINGATRSSGSSEGGQDTGKAQLVKSGYHSMEMIAASLEQIFEDGERKALTILKDIFAITKVLRFDVEDIEIKFSRNKADNISEKAAALRNLVDSTIIAPIDAIELTDLTTDPLSMATRGEEYRQQKLSELEAQNEASKEQTPTTE